MKIKCKKYVHPRFGALDVRAAITKVDIEHEINPKPTFLVDSPDLRLMVKHNYINIRLAQNKQSIDQVEFVINETKKSQSNIIKFADLLTSIDMLDLVDYWKDEDLRFLFYAYFRFAVFILTGEKTRFYIEQNHLDLKKHVLLQVKLVQLFNDILESSQIQHSDYVVNNRAIYLLILGLDPKQKYSSEQIKKVGKEWMKLTHSDAPFGEHELFLKVNEAVRYVK